MRNVNNVSMILVISIALMFLSGCHRPVERIGLTKYTDFVELPFPSNSYTVGQIVQIFSDPRKVEIIHQPDIPWDQQTVSPGWDISSTQTEEIESNLAIEIDRVLEGSYVHDSNETVQIKLTNTKTRVIPKTRIYGALKKDIENDVDGLRTLLNDYIEHGYRFDVVTMILSANISFSLVNSSGQEVEIDSEVIEKLNSEFDVGFTKKSGTNKVISGDDLVVGIHYDPQMVEIILEKLGK